MANNNSVFGNVCLLAMQSPNNITLSDLVKYLIYMIIETIFVSNYAVKSTIMAVSFAAIILFAFISITVVWFWYT